MPPDFLRLLDRLVGVPLCLLLTGWRALTEALCRPAQPELPRRVLLVQLAEAGSMVLADPAVAAIEQRGGEVCFLTFAHNTPALALTGRVPAARIYALPGDSLLAALRGVWRLRAWVRAQQIDAAIDLELFTRLSAVLLYLAGVPRRVGFHAEAGGPLYRGRLYSEPVAFSPHLHVARNYLRLVARLYDGAEAVTRTAEGGLPRVRRARPPALAHAWVGRLLAGLALQDGGRLVLVNPNASERLPQRRWPQDRYVAMIEQLLAIRPDVSVLLIGAKEDRPATRAIHAAVAHSRCLDIAGRVPMAFLPALFSKSALLVGSDSGPAHFAAVSGLPVVTLFGPETPQLFGPLGPATIVSAELLCSPCVSPANQRRSRCRDNQCMKRISVDEVLAASLAALTRHSRKPTSALAIDA